MAQGKAAAKKIVVKKTAPQPGTEEVPTVCFNCEDSGMSCAVCKKGRDDVATDVV